MSKLVLPAALGARIEAHARRAYPEECCGILVGRLENGAAVVEEVAPGRNVATGRHRRYEVDPAQLVAAHKESRRAGRRVLGYYHSHPDRPAVPSARDLEHAWPDTSYLIVAVAGGEAGELRSFRLAAGGDRFEEERLLPCRAPEK
jgi:proteasome lid subunit RPN8/RPN11